jgi:2-dehydropantoate 2-reductase
MKTGMKIGIIGAGAMGSLYGGKLAAAGAEVVLYDISRPHVEAVNASGLAILELADGKENVVRLKATVVPGDLSDADVLLVFVKSSATAAAARQFAGLAKPDAIVVTLQNGLGNEQILREAFGAERTAAGVTSQGATFLGPGRVRHAGTGPTHLCMPDNSKLAPLVEALERAGFETHVEKSIDSLVWSKLVINVGINALTALTGLPNGRLLDFPQLRALMADLVSEAVNVAAARGVGLTYAEPLAMVYTVAEKTGRNRSSMLQDFDHKRPSEIDFINGAIVREAEGLGIEVPVNRTVTRVVQALDALNAEESAPKPAVKP